MKIEPPIDKRMGWQIDQGDKCPCQGQDDMCPCQNVERPMGAHTENTARATVDMWQEERDRVGRAKGLADRLDDISERCAERAVKATNDFLVESLLARASTYQECAGLIREAIR